MAAPSWPASGGAGAQPRTAVFRTAWVFSPVGRNFVRTMLGAGAQREELRVVADQHGNPTAAPDLADALAQVLARIRDGGWRDAYRGAFHMAGGGHANWHEFAEAIFAAARPHGGPSPRVLPIATHEYPVKAARPADGRMDQSRLREVFGVSLPPWPEGLARVVKALHS
jgi:dTDP-4-dehydrorhamnose reductase